MSTRPEVVNPVEAEEFDAWCAPLVTAFLGVPGTPLAERILAYRRRTWDPERSWGMRDDGQWVATLASMPHRLTVPGGRELHLDGITNVGVLGTHRGRGFLREMMSASLRTAADRGDPASMLLAAEWPIYGRFGYAPATFHADYEVASRLVEVNKRPDAGRLRQVRAPEFVEAAAKVHEKARIARPGDIARTRDWWSSSAGIDGLPLPRTDAEMPANYVLHVADGAVDGYVSWSTVRGHQEHGRPGAVRVEDLRALTIEAYAALFRFILGTPLVDEVLLARRPVDEPLRWLLTDGRALRQTYRGDSTWLRLIDVPAVLEQRTYSAPGRLVFQIIDDTPEAFARGTYVLEAAEGRVACSPARGLAPDLVLDQRVLASTYLGGVSFSELSRVGMLEELTSGAVRTADGMFAAARPPWTSTLF
ncbi:GNAT family N-acetyltransferase [Spirillospora sp. CA-255316]